MVVDGTKASVVWPAIDDHMPQMFNPFSPAQIMNLLDSVDSLTLAPMPDRDSSKVLIPKYISFVIEHKLVPILGPRISILPDTCFAHYHHRRKANSAVMGRTHLETL